MRIRSIRPEFWTSEDVAAMDWHTRLVFIGLWSYVDDNGVGRDVERLIVASLFPLDDNLSESSVRVQRALKHLETGGQVTRYAVDGKPYLHITAWDKHQKINRPSEGRYPLPTCENAESQGALSEASVRPHLSLSAGEGEKGRRGEGENTPSSAAADGAFDDFWAAYPRKTGKDAARRSWDRVVKRAPVEDVMAGLRSQLPGWEHAERRFIPHPTTWLNQGRWQDELEEPEDVPHYWREVSP